MGHVTIKTNLHVKYESPVVNSFESETIWSTDGQADIPTYRPTLAKQDAPSSSKGAFNENKSVFVRI